jgi:hypothetical protein
MLGSMTRGIPELSFFTVDGKDERFTEPRRRRDPAEYSGANLKTARAFSITPAAVRLR